MIELNGKYTKDCVILIDDVEQEALTTIYELLDQPVCENLPVRIMPDVHNGAGGIVIGFTMPLGTMLSPNMVGVDAGCGVVGGIFKTEKKLNLTEIDKEIRNRIPMGFNINEKSIIKKFPFSDVQININYLTNKFNEKFNTTFTSPIVDDKWLMLFLKRIGMDNVKFYNSLMSLGGGNHYIELGVNELGEYLVSVHSGSRNLGQKMCMYHNNQAKKQINISESEYSKLLDDIKFNTEDKKTIPSKINDLKKSMKIGINKEYLQDEFLYEYLIDLCFTQYYAKINRKFMLDTILDIIGIQKYDTIIETIHNYVDFSDNNFMIRKGAVSGKKDEIVLLPMSMKDGVILAKAKGNINWNESLNHGAGRLMSRSKAKQVILLDDVKKSMEGIVCQLNENVIDESVFVYKNIDIIIDAIQDNAEIISIFKPILNLKDIGVSESYKERKDNKKQRDKEKYKNREAKRIIY